MSTRRRHRIVLRPTHFDVILTENMFGDILSDQAGGIVGALGLLASASIGGPVGLYEPVHGSAPDIAGKGIANPLGAILSVAMMLRHTFQLSREAECIEAGVSSALKAGLRTADLARGGSQPSQPLRWVRRSRSLCVQRAPRMQALCDSVRPITSDP